VKAILKCVLGILLGILVLIFVLSTIQLIAIGATKFSAFVLKAISSSF
jgi:hypothetical protein